MSLVVDLAVIVQVALGVGRIFYRETFPVVQDCAGQSVVAESHRDHVPRLLGAAEIYVRQRIALVKGVFAHAGDALRELYLSRLVQPQNRYSPISVMPAGTTAFVSAEQPEKTLPPRLVTLSGTDTLVSFGQLEKAESPIMVTLSGITTPVSSAQLKRQSR